jgi:UDP-4-amino-4,6-dideoxy-N-acetyl-beta-L-altrosamine N-acetyltransferase
MKLHFRNIREDDLEMILTWRTSREVTRYMFTDPDLSLEKQRRWFAQIGKDTTRLDWIINADGEDVGLVSLVHIDTVNRRCDVGRYIGAPGARGKGIGKSVELNILAYVFETLKLNKLCGEVLAFNEQAVRLHQKCGSRVEGRRRQHVCKNGEYFDVVEVGILREDYEQEVKGRISFPRATFEPQEKKREPAYE